MIHFVLPGLLFTFSTALAFPSQEEIVDQFRSEFKGKVIYRIGERGPKYYDCSTSIGFIFAKNGMLRDRNGVLLTAESYRRSNYNPAYMNIDKVNFRKLGPDEELMGSDSILMGADCNHPTHWVMISGFDEARDGRKQINWRINRLMEVKGGGELPPLPKKFFDETWNHMKFRDNNACAFVRHQDYQ